MCLYFQKGSDMLNKNTLGVKKVRGQSEVALQIGMYDQKLVEAKKLLIKNLFHYLNDIQSYFHNYDWLCHLATFFTPSL